jgi:hypothetical protein
MKANKALKRLTKIDASLSDLIDRYAASERRVKELLHDAKASVLRAKEAVSLQISTRTATKPHVRHIEQPPLQATSKPKRKLSAAGRKAIIAAMKKRWALKRAEAEKAKSAVAKKNAAKKVVAKKAAVKAAPATAARGSAPVKKAAAISTVSAPEQTVAQATAQ